MRPTSILTAIFATLLFSGAALAQSAPEEWVFTMGGDINFNKGDINRRNMPAPDPVGVRLGRNVIPWEDLTRYLAYHIDGDLNFANIETVVSERSDLRTVKSSGYAFVSHPNSLRHLIEDLGFNWFSLANNHAFDFGRDGYRETLTSFDRFQKDYRDSLLYHGVGWNREEALSPKFLTINGLRVAFAAIGITDPALTATDSQPGMLNFRSDKDYFELLDRMAAAQADYKVISIHYGTENQVELDPGQAQRFHLAATRGGANLVLGHHPHVVRPVEYYPAQGGTDARGGQDSIIFYSFGNYLMLGAANRDHREAGADWGLLGRLFLTRSRPGAPVVPTALELVPLKGMHRTPWAETDRYVPDDANLEKRFYWAQERMSLLYWLGRHELPGTGLNFGLNFQAHGIACLTEFRGPRAENLCRGGVIEPQ
jgi:poly-gamma-glutamate synthesis protein (capsule biosynthesis protein)